MEQDPKRRQGEEKRRRAPKSDMPRIEQIRRKKREKRLRAAAVLVLVLAAILAYLGGLLAPSINFFSNLLDSARIALSPGEGWPQKIEPDSLADAYSLSGGLALLDNSDLVMYSSTGRQLRRIPHGYASPAVAVGGARAVLYDRGGTDLRVESRPRTLLTRQTDYAILTAGCSDNGSFAVATRAERYTAQITIYDPSFNEIYFCYLAQDIPMLLSFSDNSRYLAAACMDVEGGSFGSRIHLYDTHSTEAGAVFRVDALPLQMIWLSDASLLVVTDSFAAVYNTADGAETARYSYGGESLLYADSYRGNLALCFGDESRHSVSRAVVVDQNMQLLAQFDLGYAVRDILLTSAHLEILGRDEVRQYDLTGVNTGTLALDDEGEFLVRGKKTYCVTAKEILQLSY